MKMPIPIFAALRKMQKQMCQLDAALTTSFANLKSDLTKQTKSLESQNARLEKQEKHDRQLKRDITELKKQQAEIAEIKESLKNRIKGGTERRKKQANENQKVFGKLTVNSTQRSTCTHQKQSAGLTPLHMEILKRLMILQTESGRRTISMKDLASELYPHKAYSTIKATLSEYIKRLHLEGFVEKAQKGRLYLSYTEKALQFADNQRLKRMKDLITRPLGSVR